LIDQGKTAVIELADASGLRLLQSKEYDPIHATTFGTGELIKYALDQHVNKIILGIGGSATVDGGRRYFRNLWEFFFSIKKNTPCKICRQVLLTWNTLIPPILIKEFLIQIDRIM